MGNTGGWKCILMKGIAYYMNKIINNFVTKKKKKTTVLSEQSCNHGVKIIKKNKV